MNVPAINSELTNPIRDEEEVPITNDGHDLLDQPILVEQSAPVIAPNVPTIISYNRIFSDYNTWDRSSIYLYLFIFIFLFSSYILLLHDLKFYTFLFGYLNFRFASPETFELNAFNYLSHVSLLTITCFIVILNEKENPVTNDDHPYELASAEQVPPAIIADRIEESTSWITYLNFLISLCVGNVR